MLQTRAIQTIELDPNIHSTCIQNTKSGNVQDCKNNRAMMYSLWTVQTNKYASQLSDSCVVS